jgi:hypothetical protein
MLADEMAVFTRSQSRKLGLTAAEPWILIAAHLTVALQMLYKSDPTRP